MREATSVVEPATPRRRRRRWPAGAAVVILAVAAGATTGLVTMRHYTAAEPLSCACGVEWAAPDNRFAHDVVDDTDGPSDENTLTQVPARPGHRQSFYVLVVNLSSVTQTVLGLPPTESVREPQHLAVAVDAGPAANEGDPGTLRFTTAPTDIPPRGGRWLRMSQDVADYDPGRTEIFTGIDVRVRVGGFTRTETISLAGGAPGIHW